MKGGGREKKKKMGGARGCKTEGQETADKVRGARTRAHSLYLVKYLNNPPKIRPNSREGYGCVITSQMRTVP